MQQHHDFGDEPLDISRLFLPGVIMRALRVKADTRSQLLRDLVNEQAERLLFEPAFFDDALRLADALWKRLARGSSGPFAWPADPLVCVGATLVFAADLESQAQKDLLIMDDNTVKRLVRRAAIRGVSYEKAVKETVGRFWKSSVREHAPKLPFATCGYRGRICSETNANGSDLIPRLDFTVECGASEPDLVKGLGGPHGVRER